MRALYFGTYDRDHPRNVNAIAAMRDAGIEVDERHAGVPQGGVIGALSVIAAEVRLFAARPRHYDVVIVGYPGHFDVPRARRVAGARPLVFDAVLSLENELVDVRGHYSARSTAANVLRAVDFRALRLPDLVVCGTQAEAAYLAERGARRTASVFLGANEDLFGETWAPAYPFTPLYVADASLDVVEAADLSPRIVEPRRLLDEDAGIAFAHAGVVLGSFRESRAIPASVFNALATGAPVVTADTAAARELLTGEESALLVPPEDPQAIASAVQRLADDEELRVRIAAAGRRVFEERASRRALGVQWRAALATAS